MDARREGPGRGRSLTEGRLIVAEILTSMTGYKNFINDMRAAFRGAVAYDAVYNRGNTYTRFHYIVQQGTVPNLYLTRITNGATAVGVATATRNLTAAEISYAGAIGTITKASLDNALATDYCVQVWSAALKKNFDIVLLCTVEAARSKYIYKKVNEMLSGKSADGDHLKDVAQMYSHTQTAAGVTAFRPLDTIDYHALYINEKERGNVSLTKYQTMGM